MNLDHKATRTWTWNWLIFPWASWNHPPKALESLMLCFTRPWKRTRGLDRNTSNLLEWKAASPTLLLGNTLWINIILNPNEGITTLQSVIQAYLDAYFPLRVKPGRQDCRSWIAESVINFLCIFVHLSMLKLLCTRWNSVAAKQLTAAPWFCASSLFHRVKKKKKRKTKKVLQLQVVK